MQTADELLSDLIARFLYTRRRADAEDLIKTAQAVGAIGESIRSPQLKIVVQILGSLSGSDSRLQLTSAVIQLHRSFEESRHDELLTSAVTLAHVGAAIVDRDPFGKMFHALSLGSCLITHFRVAHELGSLFESVVTLRDVFDEAEIGSVLWVGAATELAMALKLLAEVQSENISLAEAEDIYELLLATEPGHPEVEATHYNYANLLELKYSRTDEAEVLDKAIWHRQVCVLGTSPSHRAFSIRLLGLAEALLNRFLISENIGDLDRALFTFAQAPAEPHGVLPPVALPILHASYMLLRYDFSRARHDLLDSIQISRPRVLSVDEKSPTNRARRNCLEGMYALLKWEKQKTVQDISEAFDRFVEAISVDRFIISARWALVAIGLAQPGTTKFDEQARLRQRELDKIESIKRWQDDPLSIIAKRLHQRIAMEKRLGQGVRNQDDHRSPAEERGSGSD